ncbi:hypothetical protein BM477_05380 [Boudabousia marimammalium]|uniref:Sensor-like histidine kinase SenX3 n=1 Tax=Boudabousia marimammalium TaxID=156892 RepID=A0A1Q5PMI5_9ACTO|nr:hypothetical protein BM477_05380 [Boudabousia marimammalium]
MPVVSALLGLVVGASGVWGAWISERSRHREELLAEGAPALPLEPGVLSILAAVPYTAIVLNCRDRVVRADANAYAYGLVKEESLANLELAEIVENLRATGTVVEQELEVIRGPFPSGQTIPVMVRVAPLRDGYVLILAENLSASRRLEQTRRDFTANVSHELKTPVGAIQLLSETIENNADDPEYVQQFARSLRKESKRLANLVSDIIDLSRLEVPDALHEPELVDVDELIQNVTEMQSVLAAEKQISLVASSKNTGAAVWGDADLLTTAVRNLVDNAIRYSESGGSVSMGVTVEDELVRIAVVDQGPGIPAAEQDRIFERFYRVDPGRSRATGGTGLGLSIVKHVAMDHGGTVSVWSSPGRGSTFTLVLPQARIEDDFDRMDEKED